MDTRPSRRDFIWHACVLAASGAALRNAHAESQFVTAETAFGRVRGVDLDGVKIFKGIPYGASTAGNRRFLPPVNPARWTGVRDALEYGPSAPQREPGVDRGTSALAVAAAGLPAEGEDCLRLNIW
ncbi:MAG: carboxylesterase family protein, partial [Vicinamibacterales bacterium]